MNGNSVGKLGLYSRISDGASYRLLWSRTGSLIDAWSRAEVNLYSNKPAQILFMAEASNSTKDDGVIAIDDISLHSSCVLYSGIFPVVKTTTAAPICGNDGFKCSDGTCIKQSQVCDFKSDCLESEDESNCGVCNFETDTCGWFDDSYGGHIWNRTSAADAQIPNDVTINSSEGMLMSYQSSDDSFTGITRLYSPQLGRTSSHCEFEFYYFKIDDSPRAISFAVYIQDNEGFIDKIWSTEENSLKNDWTKVAVGLYSRAPGFKLYFEAIQIKPGSDKHKLAIDATNFLNCPINYNISCTASNAFKCANSYCIPNNLVCDFSNDCGDLSDEIDCDNYTRCNFEEDSNPYCDWNIDNDADIDWKRHSGQDFENSLLLYPNFDHTTLRPTGHFLANDYRSDINRISRISSPVFYPVNKLSKCSFRMWYHNIGN